MDVVTNDLDLIEEMFLRLNEAVPLNPDIVTYYEGINDSTGDYVTGLANLPPNQKGPVGEEDTIEIIHVINKFRYTFYEPGRLIYD